MLQNTIFSMQVDFNSETETESESCLINHDTTIPPRYNSYGFSSAKQTENISNLDKFLENERINNKKEPWCRLDKTERGKKLIDFANTYKEANQLDEDEFVLLLAFFKDCLDRKRFQKVKDVSYDKETGLIKDIPALTYTKINKHFTLKNTDLKRVSATKSLAPKKTQGTIRNKKDAIINA